MFKNRFPRFRISLSIDACIQHSLHLTFFKIVDLMGKTIFAITLTLFAVGDDGS